MLRSRFGLLPLVIPSEQKNRTRTRPCPRNPSWSMRTKKNACQVDQSKTKGEREAEPIPSQVVLAMSWRSRGLWFPTVIPTPPGSPRSNPSRLYPRITCLAHGACQRCTSTSFFTDRYHGSKRRGRPGAKKSQEGCASTSSTSLEEPHRVWSRGCDHVCNGGRVDELMMDDG